MESIFKLFSDNGLDSWLVGGAVRDRLRGIDPCDLDFVVRSDIETIARVTGGKIVGPELDRVCVFRCGPSVVEVTRLRGDSIEEDLALRDFTINAMALTPDGDLVDPLNGYSDLMDRKLRFAGSGVQRLKEDPIRALRFCRFITLLNFFPDEVSWNDLKYFIQMKGDSLFSHISDNRIGKEMLRGLNCPARFIRILFDTGLLHHIHPAFEGDAFPRAIRVVSLMNEACPEPDIVLYTASFFIALSPGFYPGKLLKGWAVPREIRERVELLVRYHVDFNRFCDRASIGRYLRKLGSDIVGKLLLISRIEEMCESDVLVRWRKNSSVYEEVSLRFKKAESDGLLISGKDLLDRGIPQGPAVGDLLEKFYDLISVGEITSKDDVSRWLNSPELKKISWFD